MLLPPGQLIYPSKKVQSVLLLLSSCCAIGRCVVFFNPLLRIHSVAAFRSPHCDYCNPRYALPRQQQQSWPLNAAVGGSDDREGGEDGKKNGGVGGEAGIGLEGDWQVKSGEGKSLRKAVGDGVGSVPGQLPEKTRDGQDWAEWAREWREDPQGKADRLMEQWDADSKAAGGPGVKDAEKAKKRNSKKKAKKRKGTTGPPREVVGTGFGGAVRQTKSVPKGLVVSETGGSKGDVVDWSTGQQLVEPDRQENMVADWEQESKRLENLGQSDRDALAEKLRMALGKKQRKRNRNPSSAASDGKGFAADRAASAGGITQTTSRDGRGALAAAAGAAGAVAVDGATGVSVFPPAPATAAGGESQRRQLPSDVVASDGGPQGGGARSFFEEGGKVAGEGNGVPPGETTIGDCLEEGMDQDDPKVEAQLEKGEESVREGLAPLQTGQQGGGDRLISFGRGVAIVEPVDNGDFGSTISTSSDVDLSGNVLHVASTEGTSVGSAEVLSDNATPLSTKSFGVSVEAQLQDGVEESFENLLDGQAAPNAKASNAMNFGRGVSMPAEASLEKVSEGDPDNKQASADDTRIGGFGTGVAFPVEPDAGG